MPDSIRDHVAGVLRAEIARLRLTQREVAARCGRSQPWVTYRLAGQRSCSVDDLGLLAKALGIPISKFLPADEPDSVAAATHPGGPTHPTPTGPPTPSVPSPRKSAAA
jgi:transcriptional regulator with XRE-family HTH domain